MPTPAISVEIQGLGKLRKITDPRLILGPTALVIRDMANLAELRAKANAPRDTGALQRSIAAQIQPLQARVGSTRNLIYFEVAEVGQAPAGKSKAPGSTDASAIGARRLGSASWLWNQRRRVVRSGQGNSSPWIQRAILHGKGEEGRRAKVADPVEARIQSDRKLVALRED